MRNLVKLPPFDDDGALRVIVESPRGSSLKFAYDPALRLFAIKRELPLGLEYPCDWGFIPGTLGADGDPLDSMVLHTAHSYPGIVLSCRILGMLKVTQREGRGKAQMNNRIIGTPSWHTPLTEVTEARDLPKKSRKELEQFFVSVVADTGKRLTIDGWASQREAEDFIRKSLVASR